MKKCIFILFVLFSQNLMAGLSQFDFKELREDAVQQLRRRFILENTDGVFYLKEKAYRIKSGSKNLSYEGDLYYVLNEKILAPDLHLAVGYSVNGASNVLAVRKHGKQVSEIDGMGVSFTQPLTQNQKLDFILTLQMVSKRALEMDAFTSDSYVTFNWNWNLPVSLDQLKKTFTENELIEYIRSIVYRDFSNTWVRNVKLGTGKRSLKADLKDLLKFRNELEQKNFKLPSYKGINFFNPLNCQKIISKI